MNGSRCLVNLRASSQSDHTGPARIVFFPYAGGGPAVFRPWSRLLPKEVDLYCALLPGREARLSEPPETGVQGVAAELVAAIRQLPIAPTLFFGHSLGALLAYEVAFRLCAVRSLHTPNRIVLSGCTPPHTYKLSDGGPTWSLPHDEFLAKLEELNGTPKEVLDSKELLELFMPVLRADFQLADNLRQSLVHGLPVVAHVLGGTHDVEVLEPDLREWQKYFVLKAQYSMLPGGHFFLNEAQSQVCTILQHHLSQLTVNNGALQNSALYPDY